MSATPSQPHAVTVGLDEYHVTLVTTFTYYNGSQGLRIRREAMYGENGGLTEPGVCLNLNTLELAKLKELLK